MIGRNKIYKFFDLKHALVFNFFSAWSNELVNCLKNLEQNDNINFEIVNVIDDEVQFCYIQVSNFQISHRFRFYFRTS